jgi:hypothetical protein
VTDCKEPKINVTENKISFEGKSGPDQSLYGFELEFYKEIKPEVCNMEKINFVNLERFSTSISQYFKS